MKRKSQLHFTGFSAALVMHNTDQKFYRNITFKAFLIQWWYSKYRRY